MMDGWMDEGWVDGWTDGWIDGCMHKHTAEGKEGGARDKGLTDFEL